MLEECQNTHCCRSRQNGTNQNGNDRSEKRSKKLTFSFSLIFSVQGYQIYNPFWFSIFVRNEKSSWERERRQRDLESILPNFFLRKTKFFSAFCYWAWPFKSTDKIFLSYKHSSLTTKIWKTKKSKIGRIGYSGVNPTKLFSHKTDIFPFFTVKLDWFIVDALFSNVTNTQTQQLNSEKTKKSKIGKIDSWGLISPTLWWKAQMPW